MKKRISELHMQLEKITELYEICEREEGKLTKSMAVSIDINKELDEVKKILDSIELKLKEEIKN